MSFRGKIQGDVILLDKPTGLPDGTEVTIEPIHIPAELQPTSGTAEQIPIRSKSLSDVLMRFSGIMKGDDLPKDGSLQVDHYVYGVPKK